MQNYIPSTRGSRQKYIPDLLHDLKGNGRKEASRPETVENLQIFSELCRLLLSIFIIKNK